MFLFIERKIFHEANFRPHFYQTETRKFNPETGIILPPTALNKQKANVGQVVAVGEKVTSVTVGDEVMFHPFDELETPDPSLVVIREKSLLAILTKEKEL